MLWLQKLVQQGHQTAPIQVHRAAPRPNSSEKCWGATPGAAKEVVFLTKNRLNRQEQSLQPSLCAPREVSTS